MIEIANCTFPLHPLPVETYNGQKNKRASRYLAILPDEKGYVHWCKDCSALQKKRMTYARRNNGFTRSAYRKYEKLLKKRFGGETSISTGIAISKYANRHAPDGHFWCYRGYHYTAMEEKRKNRSENICVYCAAKAGASAYRRWEHRRQHLRSLKEQSEFHTAKIKAARLEAKRLEKYLKILSEKVEVGEHHAGIY